ncbi:MAG TPA: hypothetical protein VNU68_04185 [Verrucomicrobiae bacterium]|nr:hypothetical protein [Verrucomicrobiae bacterium]
MKPSDPIRWCFQWGVAVLVLFLIGCASDKAQPGRYAIRLEVADVLKNIDMQVDFVADKNFTKERWKNANLNDYWPNGEFRRDAKPITFSFGPGREQSYVISTTNSQYHAWLKDSPLLAVVVRDHPDQVVGDKGASDPRILFLSLNKRDYRRTKELKVIIEESGFRVQPPPAGKSVQP